MGLEKLGECCSRMLVYPVRVPAPCKPSLLCSPLQPLPPPLRGEAD